jgi:prolyl-tRNA editing enzyme YbaK/EbsC (Cys-tRNA(Pro) deacylase)
MQPPDQIPRSARPVAQALEAAGHRSEIRLLAGDARSAEEAAAALGVEARQIVKSMVFRGADAGRLVVVLIGGDRQVDLAAVGEELGEAVKRADPDWVREQTGYSIGGIPPLGHRTAPTVLIDRNLLPEETLWAGAGAPNAMFRTAGADLVGITGGAVADVARR